MMVILFFEWLARFDAYIYRSPNRKVLLFHDNFPGHGSNNCLPPLSSVKVFFIPTNTTSRLQPTNAGIIACLKRRYHTLQFNSALDFIDEGSDNIYKIDQLTAMQLSRRSWKASKAQSLVIV